jgi:hypothetical protein
MATAQKTNKFVENVIKQFDTEDSSKIEKFQEKALKEIARAIEALEDKNEDLLEKSKEQEEELLDTCYNVQLDRLSSIDSIKNYVPAYLEGVTLKVLKQEGNKELIEANKKAIERLKKIAKIISA